jgi:MFS family permease
MFRISLLPITISYQVKDMQNVLISALQQRRETGKWHALIAAWLGEAFDGMDASLYSVAMYPALGELLRSKSDVEIGQTGSLILATFMMGWFVGALVFGTLADKIGRRKTMILTILIYSLATASCAVSQNWMQLAACRFVVGCGIGGEIILGTVVISEFWTKRGRLWAVCAVVSSFNAGLMFAAGINTLLGPYGWRWLFVAGVIPAIFTLYIRSKLKESDSFEQVRNHRNAIKQNAGSLTDRDRMLLKSPMAQLMEPEFRWKLLSTAVLSASAIIGYWACIGWLPAWVNQMTGALAINERSMITTIFSIGGFIGCFTTPFVLDRMGRKGTMKLTFGGALVISIAMFITVKSYGTPLLCWAFAMGLFTNWQFAALQIYIPEVFPTSALASAAGVCYGAARIFSAGLTLCGEQLIAFYGGSYAYASATISSIYILGFIVAFWMYETKGQVVGTMLTVNIDSENSSLEPMETFQNVGGANIPINP